MAAAPGALQQPRHALGRADLQHPLDRQEVDAEVERRGRHHRLEPAFLQAELDPVAHLLVERAVVQGDEPGPLGLLLEDQLVPGLGLRAHVDEDERRRRLVDLLDHRLLHLLAEVAAPGEAPGVDRQQGVDDQVLLQPAAHHLAVVVAEQHLHRLAQVAERRRQAPDDQPRIPAAQPGDRQLHLDAALAAHELVPFVDDDGVHAVQLVLRLLAGQHQAERLGRGDQRGRVAPVLLRPLGRGRVAGADADAPVAEADVIERRRDRPGRVGREGAHRRDPEDAERRRMAGPRP